MHEFNTNKAVKAFHIQSTNKSNPFKIWRKQKNWLLYHSIKTDDDWVFRSHQWLYRSSYSWLYVSLLMYFWARQFSPSSPIVDRMTANNFFTYFSALTHRSPVTVFISHQQCHKNSWQNWNSRICPKFCCMPLEALLAQSGLFTVVFSRSRAAGHRPTKMAAQFGCGLDVFVITAIQ